MKFKIRDILAVPFWALSQLLEYISILIGGEWTANMILEQHEELGNSNILNK